MLQFDTLSIHLKTSGLTNVSTTMVGLQMVHLLEGLSNVGSSTLSVCLTDGWPTVSVCLTYDLTG